MNKDEVAIIGGAGFIGSRLTARLKKSNFLSRKYDIDQSNQLDKSTYLDVEDIKSLDQLAGVNTIINLAAVHRDDVYPTSRYDDVNVRGKIFARQPESLTFLKLFLQALLQFMDLQRILTNLENLIILMIMAELNTWLNKFIRRGNWKTQKFGLLLLSGLQ